MQDQAKYIYKKVETENIVNVDTIKTGDRGRQIKKNGWY